MDSLTSLVVYISLKLFASRIKTTDKFYLDGVISHKY